MSLKEYQKIIESQKERIGKLLEENRGLKAEVKSFNNNGKKNLNNKPEKKSKNPCPASHGRRQCPRSRAINAIMSHTQSTTR